MDNIKLIAEEIANCLCSDSGIPVKESFPDILAALTLDQFKQGKGWVAPSDEEIKTFVVGNDDGSIPVELILRYPNTSEALESFF